VAVGSVDMLQAASTSALKSVQNVNSMHAVVSAIAERLRLVTLSVHVCYRGDVQLRETSETGKQCIKQIRDVCKLRVYYMTADDAGTYRCVARNDHGRAECQAQVTVVGKLVE